MLGVAMASKKKSLKTANRGMQSGQRPRDGVVAPVPVVAPPFHAPFQELAKSAKLRAALAPTAKAASKLVIAAAPLASRTAAVASPLPPVPVLSDAEILAASLAGVAPLPQLAARVRIRRKADFATIEAGRKEDLDALARAEGFDVTFEDKYVRARAAGVSRETVSRLEKGEFRICAHLDLHGMPLEDARKAVDEFLATQQKRGHRCVLLVTGKGKNSLGGRGVLREQVPGWLARGPSSRRVLAFASARPCDGGLGALVVLMRGGSSGKTRIDVEHGGVGPAGT